MVNKDLQNERQRLRFSRDHGQLLVVLCVKTFANKNTRRTQTSANAKILTKSYPGFESGLTD